MALIPRPNPWFNPHPMEEKKFTLTAIINEGTPACIPCWCKCHGSLGQSMLCPEHHCTCGRDRTQAERDGEMRTLCDRVRAAVARSKEAAADPKDGRSWFVSPSEAHRGGMISTVETELPDGSTVTMYQHEFGPYDMYTPPRCHYTPAVTFEDLMRKWRELVEKVKKEEAPDWRPTCGAMDDPLSAAPPRSSPADTDPMWEYMEAMFGLDRIFD